jgi:long-chain fatty acid transport protein
VRKLVHRSILLGAATIALCEVSGITQAQAGGFGVREQSALFLGTAFAGSAAGGDLSSMYWNSAATAVSPGCSFSSSLTGIFPRGEETAVSGLFVTGLPPVAAGLTSTSTDVATDALVPSSYAACQVTDRLYLGLGLNSPFGFRTKPDNTGWAGSPIATSSRVFSVDINPTLAYKVTPELTVGVGVQVEYFKLRLNHGFPLAALRDHYGGPGVSLGSGSRSERQLHSDRRCNEWTRSVHGCGGESYAAR